MQPTPTRLQLKFILQRQIHLADIYVFHVLRFWANLISHAMVPVGKKTN